MKTQFYVLLISTKSKTDFVKVCTERSDILNMSYVFHDKYVRQAHYHVLIEVRGEKSNVDIANWFSLPYQMVESVSRQFAHDFFFCSGVKRCV